jgi:pimeloyl-ACP methyl ester carboxylesterase
MPKALVNGIDIHYQYAGHGPNVVLIHGLATNLAFWYLAIFWALRKDFRVIVYDLRGHGQSAMPPSGYTSADMASDLDALLDHLNVKQAHVVGHSFGGAVALHHAVLHPERVASLTLADPRVLALYTDQARQGWPYRKIWGKNLQELGLSMPENDSDMGLSLLEELIDSRTTTRKRVDSEQSLPSVETWQGNKQNTARWRHLLRTTTIYADVNAVAGLTLQKIHQIRQPALAIYGQRSRLLATCPVLRKTLPHCRIVVLPGVGHFHPLRQPAVFVQNLRKFLMGLRDE